MSSGLRALQSRHHAWCSFRDIAHATRSLAASRRSRWAGHAQRSGEHLAWVWALAKLLPAPAQPQARPKVLVGIGTDLGLCGRLNQLVAEAFLRRRAELNPALSVAIGERLGQVLGETELPTKGPALVAYESAPVSPAAVLELAERLELSLQKLGLQDAQLDLVAAVSEDAGVPDVRCEPSLPAALEGDVRAIEAQLHRERRVLSDLAAGRERVLALLRHARLAHAFCRAQVVESAVRWTVMHRAHEGAQRRIGEQELELRRLRQEEITQEMLDVVSGRGIGV